MSNIFYDSPLGVLEIISKNSAVVKIEKREKAGKENPDAVCQQAKQELIEYFNNKRQDFSFKLELLGTAFQIKVWQALLAVPYGKVISYQQLADRVGNPKGVRAVANAVGSNPILIVVPCHRIIGTNHSLTGFGAGLENKVKLLELEKWQIKLHQDIKKSVVITTN